MWGMHSLRGVDSVVVFCGSRCCCCDLKRKLLKLLLLWVLGLNAMMFNGGTVASDGLMVGVFPSMSMKESWFSCVV